MSLTGELRRDAGQVLATCDAPTVQARGWDAAEALEALAAELRRHAVERVLGPVLDGETAA